MTRTEQLAWVAGLIDGEGCITITRCFPKRKDLTTLAVYRLMLKVSMGDRKAIYRLRRIFGFGNVKWYPPRKGKRVNGHYCWTIETHKALSVIEAIRPYLVTKREEAKVAVAFMRLPIWQVGGSGGNSRVPAWLTKKRDDFYWRLRKMKPRWKFYKSRLRKVA